MLSYSHKPVMRAIWAPWCGNVFISWVLALPFTPYLLWPIRTWGSTLELSNTALKHRRAAGEVGAPPPLRASISPVITRCHSCYVAIATTSEQHSGTCVFGSDSWVIDTSWRVSGDCHPGFQVSPFPQMQVILGDARLLRSEWLIKIRMPWSSMHEVALHVGVNESENSWKEAMTTKVDWPLRTWVLWRGWSVTKSIARLSGVIYRPLVAVYCCPLYLI